jgi:CBS domain-containing protein
MTADPFELSPFHDVGKLFAGETSVTATSPETPVLDALESMLEHRYSQLPVMDEGVSRGSFSLWSLARFMKNSQRADLAGLTVEDLMDPPLAQVSVGDSLYATIKVVQESEAVVVAHPGGLQAMVTAVDLLNYFYKVARPFVLVGEIELAIRALIQSCTNSDEIKACAKRALSHYYSKMGRDYPTDVTEMSFDDYCRIVGSSGNWPTFEGVLGRNRQVVTAKLTRVRDIRNAVFHFRKDVTSSEYDDLASAREWLLDKVLTLQRRRRS